MSSDGVQIALFCTERSPHSPTIPTASSPYWNFCIHFTYVVERGSAAWSSGGAASPVVLVNVAEHRCEILRVCKKPNDIDIVVPLEVEPTTWKPC